MTEFLRVTDNNGVTATIAWTFEIQGMKDALASEETCHGVTAEQELANILGHELIGLVKDLKPLDPEEIMPECGAPRKHCCNNPKHCKWG